MNVRQLILYVGVLLLLPLCVSACKPAPTPKPAVVVPTEAPEVPTPTSTATPRPIPTIIDEMLHTLCYESEGDVYCGVFYLGSPTEALRVAQIVTDRAFNGDAALYLAFTRELGEILKPSFELCGGKPALECFEDRTGLEACSPGIDANGDLYIPDGCQAIAVYAPSSPEIVDEIGGREGLHEIGGNICSVPPEGVEKALEVALAAQRD